MVVMVVIMILSYADPCVPIHRLGNRFSHRHMPNIRVTILRKREGYRKAFCDFDTERVAQMTDEDVERLMRFEGIVKNRQKIKSTITNARLFLAIQKEFGSFYNYTLSFFPDRKPIINTFRSLSEIPVTSPESEAMSKDMKKRGFKFFGPTICYAHLQASGFINDHLIDCVCRKG